MPLRPHQQQRAVGGTTADVHHQHAFFVLQRGFIIQSRRDRLVLKHHILETGAFGRTLKNTLCLGVGVVAA